jgi:hypothetical protein
MKRTQSSIQECNDEQQQSKRIKTSQQQEQQPLLLSIHEIINYMQSSIIKKQNGKEQEPARVNTNCQLLQYVHVLQDECPVTKESYWLYFTCGFSDIYNQVPNNRQGDRKSGYGYELILRLRRNKAIEDSTDTSNENFRAPMWPILLFKYLASYAEKSGQSFNNGDWMPGDLDTRFVLPEHGTKCVQINAHLKHNETNNIQYPPHLIEASNYYQKEVHLRSYLFCYEDYLKTITTNSGSVKFIQIIPVTQDELEFSKSWDAKSFIKIMRERTGVDLSASERVNPLLICDIHRESILKDEILYQECQNYLETMGSSSSSVVARLLHVMKKSPTNFTVTLSERQLQVDLKSVLLHTVPFYRDLTIIGSNYQVAFFPLEELDVTVTSNPAVPPPPSNTILKKGLHATEEQQLNQESGQCHFIEYSATTLILKCSNEFIRRFTNTEFTTVKQFYEWPDLFPGLTIQVVPTTLDY